MLHERENRTGDAIPPGAAVRAMPSPQIRRPNSKKALCEGFY
jgi:hypothetical protein